MFDRQGQRLVAASGDAKRRDRNLPGQVVVYELKDKRSIAMKDYDHPSVRALFSPDGKVVVSAGVDGVATGVRRGDGRSDREARRPFAADHRPRFQPRRHASGHRQR